MVRNGTHRGCGMSLSDGVRQVGELRVGYLVGYKLGFVSWRAAGQVPCTRVSAVSETFPTISELIYSISWRSRCLNAV